MKIMNFAFFVRWFLVCIVMLTKSDLSLIYKIHVNLLLVDCEYARYL